MWRNSELLHLHLERDAALSYFFRVSSSNIFQQLMVPFYFISSSKYNVENKSRK